MKRSNRRLALVLSGILLAFVLLIGYLVYFPLFRAQALRKSSLNMRNWVDESKFGRGHFLDHQGYEITERWQDEEGTYQRRVKHPHMYAHLIGYNSPSYGKTGLERAYNDRLLNLPTNAISELRGQVLSQGVGNDVRLTIDNDLQYESYSALEEHKGAAVVLDVETGAIRAMVSLPSFNLENLEEDWGDLVEDPDSRLFPRASQGLYAPGSVMKPLTAMALLENGVDLSYEDQGSTLVDGYSYSNFEEASYGEIGLTEALMYSSNVYFVDKTRDLDPEKMEKTMEEFGMNRELPLELPTAISQVPYAAGMDLNQKVSQAFGQGKDLVSPLAMARAYMALVNGGRLLRPHLVEDVQDPQGNVLTGETIVSDGQLNPSYCKIIQEALVKTGDYYGMEDWIGQAAGAKTGTAQTASGSTNAWTLAFAPADAPKYLVCVVLEEDGRTGAEAALPLCAHLLEEALKLSE